MYWKMFLIPRKFKSEMGYNVSEEFNEVLNKRKAMINLKKCKAYEEKQLRQGRKYIKLDHKTYVLR